MGFSTIIQSLADWWIGEQLVFRIWIGVIALLVVVMVVILVHGVRVDRRKKARQARTREIEASPQSRSGRLSEALGELDQVDPLFDETPIPEAAELVQDLSLDSYLYEFDVWQETGRPERAEEKPANTQAPVKPPAKENAKSPAKETAKSPAKEAAKPAAKEAAKPAAKEATKPAAKETAKPAAKENAKPAAKENVKPAVRPKTSKPVGEPVISVRHVTMVFRVATSNVSGLKEYVIQAVKKKISHRELVALNDVSFDVYKGEVVGVIGTNGSGKSTLLRIVSGALRPTSGEVIVDHKKVQLLTLGTGFDQELTAKENVYLNGAIIGYSRAFLDEHYDEIVEFAELQDFMEEKVKNFSSGMVSRLGFAIATAGGAAEILILDELLSVGDEFFRKKSLARINEMIHGGSTVLMVSHNMNTILENCTKAVWIERGDLKMIGDPKTVCNAYMKMNEQ